MTTPKTDTGIRPVMLNKQETAALLGMSATMFGRKYAILKKMGFPEAHPFLKKWYKYAVLAWLDGQFGLDGISRRSAAAAEREKEEPL